jgi:NifU-like protein involved in Fe-S cluster formation
MNLMVKLHCSVLAEGSVKAAIEDYKKKQSAEVAEV